MKVAFKLRGTIQLYFPSDQQAQRILHHLLNVQVREIRFYAFRNVSFVESSGPIGLLEHMNWLSTRLLSESLILHIVNSLSYPPNQGRYPLLVYAAYTGYNI
jgi:hypothetical protein